MKAITIEVNKKVNGKYNKVGEAQIFVPLLNEDCDFDAEITGEEDGLPVYKEDRYNWIQGAMLAAAKAQARNKLQPGTATLKTGATIAADWAALCAEGERQGADALAAVREAKAAFAAWVATLGKSAAAQTTLQMLFGNRQALSLQSAEHKAKMVGYVTDFAEALTDVQADRFGKYLQSLVDVCEVTEEAEDF